MRPVGTMCTMGWQLLGTPMRPEEGPAWAIDQEGMLREELLYREWSADHSQTAEALRQKHSTYPDTQVDREHNRRLPPVPPMVRVSQDVKGDTKLLRGDHEHDSEDIAKWEAERDALAARIAAKKRGSQGACADPQAAQRRRPDDRDADPRSEGAQGSYAARDSGGASSSSASAASVTGATPGRTSTGAARDTSDALNALARNRRLHQGALPDDIFGEVPPRHRTRVSLWTDPWCRCRRKRR